MKTSRRLGTPSHGAAFTLLELLVVLTILGLLTAVVATRVRQPYRSARIGDGIQRILFTERQARSHAGRFAQSGRLVFDLQHNAMFAECENDSGQQEIPHFRLALNQNIQIDRVRLPGEYIESGLAKIPITHLGQTPSYAVRLRLAAGETRWLFFAGLTGQSTELTTESDVDQLFKLLEQSGPDAH